MHAEGKYLLFVSKPSGYELLERNGEPPAPGAEVELEEGARFTVVKVGPVAASGRRAPVRVPPGRVARAK